LEKFRCVDVVVVDVLMMMREFGEIHFLIHDKELKKG